MAQCVTRQLVTELAAAAIVTVATPPLSANRVMEYVNSVALSEASKLSDLVEAGYDGYARGSIASWVGPEVDLNGNMIVAAAVPVAFSCSGALTVQSVIGSGVLDSTGATLLFAADYPTPISPTPGQVHAVTPKFGPKGTVDSCLC
jgi:hypothetical protein